MSAESTKEATETGHKVTTVVEGTDATAAPPSMPTDKARTNLTAFALEDHVKKTFPMYVMPIATFLELETMRP